ncbi:hypothetical protein EHR05_07860 [Leptospira licerasiae]|nr:hypothetical protein EHR05_07860 [Leptospira licerasiae]
MNLFSKLRSVFTYVICISLCPLSARENVWKYTISQDLNLWEEYAKKYKVKRTHILEVRVLGPYLNP